MNDFETGNQSGATRVRAARYARMEFLFAGLTVIAALVWGGGRDSRAATAGPTAGTGGAAGGVSGPGGAPSVGFSDGFEAGGAWGFFNSGGHGNGYVSNRPADALSPTRVGDLYDSRDAAPGYEVLSKVFPLSNAGHACGATVFIKPLSDVGGVFELRDASSKAVLSSTAFQLPAGNGWTAVNTRTDSSTPSNAILVRVVLQHNGSWQELLVDDLRGVCEL